MKKSSTIILALFKIEDLFWRKYRLNHTLKKKPLQLIFVMSMITRFGILVYQQDFARAA